MQPRPEEDTRGSLERAREALYRPVAQVRARTSFSSPEEHAVPHAWSNAPLPKIPQLEKRHVRLAGIFFAASVAFFVVALGVAGYFFYYGSNSVSTDKIALNIQGPQTIVGGDTVPLSLTITNKNPVTIENATIEIDFPEGTRNATNVLAAYPRYVEKIGTLASGATITRSVKAVVFGGAGQTIQLPVTFSYGTASSNAVFEKKSSYDLAISSTPLSVSVDSLTETVSGAPITFTMTVRSNATIPLSNVVLTTTSPFGFLVTSSSVPLSNSSFLIGTLAPGASKQVTLTGTLTGQNNEQRVFHFTVGTAKSSQDQSLAVTYMSQDATVTITSPFITTTLAVNGDTSANGVVAPGSLQNVSLSYTNTLPTPVTDASITVTIAGSAIDYNSIRTTSGFYNSVNHSIVFSKDTDPALASFAPGASGLGSFTFSTVSAGVTSPTISFSVSASGTRVGQANVPEQVTTVAQKTVKVATAVALSASSSHTGNSGPVPPRTGQTTVYTVTWNAQNSGNAIAGGTVTATLPNYVSYVGATSGSGSFSYDNVSHTLTWSTGDISQGGNAQGSFKVSITPSTSQKGGVVPLTGVASFSGFDRFAGIQVKAASGQATTEVKEGPQGGGIVQ